MIITIDVGNTNITVGVFNGDEIVASFRMTTKMPPTSDEYGMLLTNLLEQNRIHCDEIQDAIIASVVPNVMHSLEGAVIKYLNIRPIVIEPGTKTGIRIVTENPRQIGADRIVDAAYPVSQPQESVFPQRHSGRMQQNFRRLRSRNRTASLQKKPSRVCRLGWCMDRSDRQNTLSAI